MIMSRSVILIGGGGHCRSVIDVAESVGINIIGIIDMPEQVGNSVLGYPVIGTDDDIPSFAGDADFIITVGQIKDNSTRKKIADIVVGCGGRFATLVANDAYVSEHASVGEGTVVMHKAVINAGAIVGKNCIINTMANIEHDVRVGDFCHVSTGVTVNGGATIGSDTFIGSGSIVFNGISIDNNSIIPAGSVVRGTPAK